MFTMLNARKGMSIEGAHREEKMREEQQENTSSKPSTLRSSNLEKKQ
jgi:hypothetical protein